MPTNKNVRNSTIEKMPTIMSKSTIKMPTYHPKMPKKMSENLLLKDACIYPKMPTIMSGTTIVPWR